MEKLVKLTLALLAALWLASVVGVAVVDAQEKDAAALAATALIRENEALKREILGLKATVKDREARLQLLQQNLDLALKVASSDPEAEKAVEARCADLERRLRALEDPAKVAVFDCRALTFSHPEKKP